ncbi:MAG: SRPBCC domain-containing protein [Sphingobacterium composti]|uniref:SRPBCC family protein n=1 Tax=Sphingobacterium composti TaxID=363260 RepID=UPI00135C105C|nr:SRPBCC domain-containing protein [Sphingobacterium composti Ten et al. 2007 non Yoo et al. 2007]
MKKTLAFDFSIDKGTNTIKIKKEFEADLVLTWEAWTTEDWLDQWWGPQPWHVETKILDFIPHGIWMYAMVSPEGDKHWSLSQFIEITPTESFSYKPGFSDEEGIINPDMPQSTWNVKFSPLDNATLVDVSILYNETQDLDTILEMGFKEGITICLQQLDDLLERRTSHG